jgi:hypothetical protein
LFPFDSLAYPFTFNLEPLSRITLAQYIYREAPAEFFDDKRTNPSDADLRSTVCGMLGVPATRQTSIYAAIAAAATEVDHLKDADLPDLTGWIKAVRLLEERGGEYRFAFVRDLFLGSHPVFAGHADVWSLPISAPGYPSHHIASNPVSCPDGPLDGSGHTPLALARLGNLQYGTTLLLLDLYFRQHLPAWRSLAVAHMIGPVRSIGKHLPRLGAGMSFEAIGVPDSSGLTAKRRMYFILALLREGQALTEALGSRLPPDYPLSINKETMARIEDIARSQPR